MKSQRPAALWRQMKIDCLPFDLEEQRPLVAAVSGGADSIALLHLLKKMRGPQGLLVAHLNHQLRAAAADDAAFVAGLAAEWDLPCVVEAVDVAAQAAAGLGVEAAARQARYAFLARAAQSAGAAAVVTGHHADDQVETLLLHLLRGSGSAGLRGMRPVAPLPGSPDLLLLRPLLNISRDTLRTYCAAHGLPYREDASNEDLQFFRNRLRHELLPLLRRFAPHAARHLRQTAAILAADYDQLREAFATRWPQLCAAAGDDWLALSRPAFAAASVSDQRMALRTAVETLRPGAEIGFRAVEAVRRMALSAHTGGSGDLPGGLRARIGYRRIWIAAATAALPPDAPQIAGEQALPVPGEVALGENWLLRADLVAPAPELVEQAAAWEAYIALPATTPLYVRGRREGERMQPLGMAGRHVTLKKVMINRKIDRYLRSSWPIVVTAAHPVWMVGHLTDERVRARNQQELIHLRCFQRGTGVA